jgi:hypothetical protein
MIKKLLLLSLTLFSVLMPAQNFVASYGFANVTTSTGTIDPTLAPSINGVSFSPFSAVGSFTNPNASGRFSFIGWPTGATDGVDTYSTFTGAASPTLYYEVTLNPQPTYSLSLSSIVFSVRRSATGIRNYAVRSSVDSYSANLPASVASSTKISVVSPDVFFWNFDATSTSADQRGNTINLGGTAFTSFTNSVTFRFYGWNAEGSGGTFSIDSVVFNGSAANSTQTVNTTFLTEKSSTDKIHISPNPCQDGIVTISPVSKTAIVNLTNILGEIVLTSKNERSEDYLKLNLTHLPQGTYFVRILDGNKNKVEKIILTRQ